MIKIDWKKDYQSEFICPYCNNIGIKFVEKECKNNISGIKFSCPKCLQTCKAAYPLNINPVLDPNNPGVIWYTNQKIKGFICPNCQSENIYFAEFCRATRKKRFRCRTCFKRYSESINLTIGNISRRSKAVLPIKNFNFDENRWDLRATNPNFELQGTELASVNFASIHPDWFREETKKYIQYLCKAGKDFSTVLQHLSALRFFSRYLNHTELVGFHQINRSLILDYLAYEEKVDKKKLSGLRSFFTIGTVRGWFNIDPNIIRNNDYPKQHRGNPDPLSDTVVEQIEQNLHKIPDPIARMWVICYFTAMRPSEVALLKKDCLVQEGQQWKLVWQRKKTSDYHEVPISRTIAKVVQGQREYIQNLWKDEWNYLFCNYHGLSSTDPSQPKLEPVKKVITTHCNNPFVLTIRCLIKTLNICDENGQLAQFSPRLLRSTRLTQLFEQGHDLAVVSAWAGHKQLATTSTYYTFVSCELMEREGGHIQEALVNSNGQPLLYESLPKSFWKTPTAHKLELSGTHINTPIYGFCGLPLEQDCHKFRACYTCSSFVAVPEKLSQYIENRDELRAKESNAKANGQEVLVEQFGRQADHLEKIIAGLQEAV